MNLNRKQDVEGKDKKTMTQLSVLLLKSFPESPTYNFPLVIGPTSICRGHTATPNKIKVL